MSNITLHDIKHYILTSGIQQSNDTWLLENEDKSATLMWDNHENYSVFQIYDTNPTTQYSQHSFKIINLNSVERISVILKQLSDAGTVCSFHFLSFIVKQLEAQKHALSLENILPFTSYIDKPKI